MDMSYQADSAIQTQKVVQLKPNGKIANLPFDSNLNNPKDVGVIASVRMVNIEATKVLKLTDTLYLQSYVNYDEANTPVRFILWEKQPDGTYLKKTDVASTWYYNWNITFHKISASKVLVFLNEKSTSALLMGVVTINGYAVTCSAKQNASLITVFEKMAKLKETEDKIYFAGVCRGGTTLRLFTVTYDKNSDVLDSAVASNIAGSPGRAGAIRVIDEGKVAVWGIYQPTSTHNYPVVGYANITYDESGAVTIAFMTPLNSAGSIYNVNYNYQWDSAVFWDDYLHVDVWENNSGTHKYYFDVYKLTDPATNKIDYLGRFTQPAPAGRKAVLYFKDRHEKWAYMLSNESSPNECRIDISVKNVYPDSTNIIPSPYKFQRTLKIGLGQQLSYVSLIQTEENEIFLAYSSGSPYTSYLKQLDVDAFKNMPIGVARSQSLVTLDGACGGFSGLEVGRRYYYDENGDISIDVQGTLVGTAITPTTIFMEKTLF
ncbi:hypothetical protein EDM59_01505 [Brevibacillus nitrificans]|uniref:Uncharacterized protein n=1 Tax=Brevibacillus nitrificans TaxID=651560 RepID=A0A3M8DPU3_9BACL|nr:hypothetical protein [Brevibacillus nitrificans]RNB90150.1 hypothetical protein EDM59_01505 [Brevibacillus nitrificans]